MWPRFHMNSIGFEQGLAALETPLGIGGDKVVPTGPRGREGVGFVLESADRHARHACTASPLPAIVETGSTEATHGVRSAPAFCRASHTIHNTKGTTMSSVPVVLVVILFQGGGSFKIIRVARTIA